jgi:hypothetical protein
LPLCFGDQFAGIYRHILQYLNRELWRLASKIIRNKFLEQVDRFRRGKPPLGDQLRATDAAVVAQRLGLSGWIERGR